MENFRCAIGFLAIIYLLQVLLIPVNASNLKISSLNSTNSSNSNSTTNSNSTELVKIVSNSTETEIDDDDNESSNSTSEASKKDKRQAQRGYTDIPLDEGPYEDVTNSSPSSLLPGFESDLPPLAENLNNELPSNYVMGSSSGNLNRDPQSSFFSQKLGLAAVEPQDNIALAADPIQERIGRDESFDSGDGKPIPGEAGLDYPVLATIPRTGFSCKQQQWPGYYADTEARCQVFWICQKHRMDAFLCPNGTLFNQQVFVCDWWFNVDCPASTEYYSRNRFLYSGPGIGIDGKPTRRGGGAPAGVPSSSNVFANSVLPVSRPSGVSSNPLVNQVQSSNQIARVANVNTPQAQSNQQPLRVQSSNSYQASSTNNNQQKYSNNDNRQTFPQPTQNGNQNQQNYNQNSNQQNYNQQNYNNLNQKYGSNQNMLANRMQKNPTGKPLQSSSSNQVVGGYQSNTLSLNSQSELDRKAYPSSSPQNGGNGKGNSYEGNRNLVSVSSTRRPDSGPSPSSPRPPPSQTPQINVNIDTSKNKKQTLGSVSSNNGGNRNTNTISSTGRPLITDVPLFSPGSSKTPSKDIKQIGTFQNIYNASTTRQTTGTPNQIIGSIRTTGKPPNRDYIANLQPPRPSSPPQSLTGNQNSSPRPGYGAPGFTQSRPTSLSSNNSPNSNFGRQGYLPLQETTTPVSSQYGAPGHTPGTPQSYVDRGGVGNKENQQRNYVSSSSHPQGFNNFDRKEFTGFLGQRSNQFSNVNGQREIMYSQSASTIYAEYPYSPSQQKNKQHLLELKNSKGITKAKDLFSYPHFHGQRSNSFSDGDSISFINNNNQQVNIDHSGHSQRKNPFTLHQQPESQNVHGGLSNNLVQHLTPNQPHQGNHNQQNQPLHGNHKQQNQPLDGNHKQQNVGLNQQNNQQQFRQQLVNHQQSGNLQQLSQQIQPQVGNQNNQKQFAPNHNQQQLGQQNNQHQYPHIPQQLSQNPNQQFNPHQNQQQFQQNTQQQPQAQQSIQQFSQAKQPHSQFPYTNPSPTPPFHQRIVTIPSQNLELPAVGQYSGNPHPSSQSFTTRDGFTSLQSGSYMSIASTASPFSKQILNHSVFQGESSNSKHTKNNGPSFVTTSTPSYSSSPRNFNNFVSSTSQPQHQYVSLSTTLRPPALHSSASPFTNDGVFSSSSLHPTAYPSQNTYVVAPTQFPYQTTSPGHRQNPYLPHNHGKRTKNSQQVQTSNSVVTTTIKYPEGIGNLKVLVNNINGNRNLLDFSYSANPKSPSVFPSSTTSFPSVTERFNHVVSSTTGRPLNPSPHPPHRNRSGTRLAGSVVNKSSSSSSAIYVDNSDTAESVSTPVSVSPSATISPPVPVSTTNFGLRISSTAKKRMAGAWQNYFSGNDKEHSNNNSSSNSTKSENV